MPNEKLEPGGRPKKHSLVPVKGPDGIYRIDRVRHRRFNGTYTRTSASGYTPKECLAEWERAFERNRNKGSTRRSAQRHSFELSDPMSIAFKRWFDLTQKRVDAGKIAQKTHDLYWAATYPSEGPKGDPSAIRLDSEIGNLSIGEVGRPVFLSDYLEDVAAVVPGIAEHQYIVLKGTFKMLTNAGAFDVNPMSSISTPERAETNQRCMFPEEVEQLYRQICVRSARTPWVRMMFLLMLGTGIRPGEAYGLRWSDIPDLDDRTVDKVVARIAGTAVKPRLGGTAFRQAKRKNARRGQAYYITLPAWLTAELRAHKAERPPFTEDGPILMARTGQMVRPTTGDAGLARARVNSTVEWVTWGNFRDTVATHIAGRTGDARRASAQLGHTEGAVMATTTYIDPNAHVHAVVDNSEVLEELSPLNAGAKLEYAGSRR